MSEKQKEAVTKIERSCAVAKDGQAVDIPLSIFHDAYGVAHPALESVIEDLKRRFAFSSHELDRNEGLLRLIK